MRRPRRQYPLVIAQLATMKCGTVITFSNGKMSEGADIEEENPSNFRWYVSYAGKKMGKRFSFRVIPGTDRVLITRLS